MSFIGKGQDGQVPVSSGNSIVWQEPVVSSGITSPLDDAFEVLDNTATAADINAALAAKDIVYLRAGTYQLDFDDVLTIPDGKQLIGLVQPGLAQTSTKIVEIKWGTGGGGTDGPITSTPIIMKDGAVLKKMRLDFFSSGQNGSLTCIDATTQALSVDSYVFIEEVYMDNWFSANGLGILMYGGTVRKCLTGPINILNRSNTENISTTIVEQCRIIANAKTSGAALEVGESGGGVNSNSNVVIRNNYIQGAIGGAGILNPSSSCFNFAVTENLIWGITGQSTNGIEGFSNAGEGVIISNNYIKLFDIGAPDGNPHLLSAAAGTDRAKYINNISENNRVALPAVPASWLDAGNTSAT